ncbi:unnamed protein product [Ambrosiozyma monospora]|uniref:Unnamed protein product n=1 Tax=Ambrosiozyma monospora TaxID=43982 RepID=A0ACB5TSL1_AMBMO|nr:unnamed protein product [Ambrosiozyma monospora]
MNPSGGYPGQTPGARMPNQYGRPPPQRSPVQQQFRPGHRATNSADLAKQYERDIHQINKYLFRELGENGHRAERYIAHVRIIEDSKSPSSRPPPNSHPRNKKSQPRWVYSNW